MIDCHNRMIKRVDARGACGRGREYSFAVPLAIRPALALVTFAGMAMACSSSSNDDCTCVVEQNGERRTLACGQTSCVGGVVITCAEQDKSAQRGACTPTPGTSEPPGDGTPDAGNGAPPDRSCDDLRTFCTTSCSNPASVSADCQTTASAGDPQACAAWQLTSGLLCMP